MIADVAVPELYLIALRPPGNIERTLIDVQELLFRRYALVSALALRPHVPLAFLAAAPPPPRAARQASAIATGGWKIVGDTLFLGATPAGWLQELAAQTAAGCTPARRRPYPAEPALYLASGDPEGSTLEALAGELGGAPALRWETSWLECTRLELAASEEWWERVSTEVVWSVRMAKPSRAYETG